MDGGYVFIGVNLYVQDYSKTTQQISKNAVKRCRMRKGRNN